MPATITLAVTRDHVARGVPKNPVSCPIALSLKDAGYHLMSVGGLSAMLYGPDASGLYLFDQTGGEFVHLFDRLASCDPAVRVGMIEDAFVLSFPLTLTFCP